MVSKKKNKYTFLKEGHSICSCCRLEYWKGSVLNGFTIVSVKKDDKENRNYIDIPLKEIPNLIKIATQCVKENGK